MSTILIEHIIRMRLLNEQMNEGMNTQVHLEPNADVLHRPGMNLTSAQDALGYLPFSGRAVKTFHLSHGEGNSEDQD